MSASPNLWVLRTEDIRVPVPMTSRESAAKGGAAAEIQQEQSARDRAHPSPMDDLSDLLASVPLPSSPHISGSSGSISPASMASSNDSLGVQEWHRSKLHKYAGLLGGSRVVAEYFRSELVRELGASQVSSFINEATAKRRPVQRNSLPNVLERKVFEGKETGSWSGPLRYLRRSVDTAEARASAGVGVGVDDQADSREAGSREAGSRE
jgi:hypothetical protein